MTMSHEESKELYLRIKDSSHYLEFGSGESTKFASTCDSIRSIDSVESSESFVHQYLMPCESIRHSLTQGLLTFHIFNIGETVQWGLPANDSRKHLWPNYSLSVFNQAKVFDLILIDGRFRVASCLASLLSTPHYNIYIS